MTQTATLIESLPDAVWTQAGGVSWMNCEGRSPREIATAMRDTHARFITITAYQQPNQQGSRLEYHWDLEGKLLGFSFLAPDNTIDSIFDICPAADWIEREVYEGFAIEFTGRVHEPLQLRSGQKPGVNLREEVAR
jgi:NADH:ubiquinone oxidoreductase subunit C